MEWLHGDGSKADKEAWHKAWHVKLLTDVCARPSDLCEERTGWGMGHVTAGKQGNAAWARDIGYRIYDAEGSGLAASESGDGITAKIRIT